MGSRLQFRQSSARRGFYGRGTRCNLDRLCIFVWYTNRHEPRQSAPALRVAGIFGGCGRIAGRWSFRSGPSTASSTAWSTRKARCSEIRGPRRSRPRLAADGYEVLPSTRCRRSRSTSSSRPKRRPASAGVAPVGQRRYRATRQRARLDVGRTASGDDQPCRPDPIKTNRPSVAIFCGEHHRYSMVTRGRSAEPPPGRRTGWAAVGAGR